MKNILKIAFLILVFALVHNRWVTPRISYDQMRQLVALENVSNGHGITFQLVGESTQIQWDNSFPPGYYMLLLPFYKLVQDPVLLHRVFEVLGLLLFISQLLLLGKYVEKKYGLPNAALIVVVFAMVQLNPLRSSGFTDIWALFFFTAALRMALSVARPAPNRLILIGLLSFATIGMRYAYYPLAFIPPLLIIWRLSHKDWQSYISLVSLGVLVGIMKVFDHVYYKGFNHLETILKKDTWNWSHLGQMEPVGFNAFFSEHVVFGLLNLNRFGVNMNWAPKYTVLATSTLIIILLIWLTAKHLKANQGIKFRLDGPGVAIWGTVIVNVGFISALSVYFPSYNEDYMYTWSLITRYFAPAYILLQLLAIVLWFRANIGWEKYFIRTLIVTSLCFQTAYFTSYTWRFSLTDTWANYVRFYDRPEMPEVIKNYQLLLKNHDMMIEIPKEHQKYEYLSIYYLSGNPHLVPYLEKNCPECLQ